MSGCTTASDHHYLFPAGLERRDRHPGRGGARARHPHDADARLDEPVGEGRRPAARQRGAGRRHDPRRLRARDRAAITTPRDGAMLQVALAPCSPFTVTKRADARERRARRALRLPPAHPSRRDARRGRTTACERLRLRPVDYLEEVGWLSDRTWLAHGIHFNDDEIARLGRPASASAIARPRT